MPFGLVGAPYSFAATMTVTRDKLKRAPESFKYTAVLHVPTDDVTNSQSSDGIVAESDSEEELDEPRYNLRSRRNARDGPGFLQCFIQNWKFFVACLHRGIRDSLHFMLIGVRMSISMQFAKMNI